MYPVIQVYMKKNIENGNYEDAFKVLNSDFKKNYFIHNYPLLAQIITFNNLRGKFSEESKISNEKKEYVKFEYSLSEDQSSISSEIKNINENKNSSEKTTFPFIKCQTPSPLGAYPLS